MSRRRFFWSGDEWGQLASDTWRHPRERISLGRGSSPRWPRQPKRTLHSPRWADTARYLVFFFTLIQKYACRNELNLRTIRETCLIRCLGNWLPGVQNVLAIIYFGSCPERIPNSSTIVIRVKNITDTIFGFFFFFGIFVPSSTNNTRFTMTARGGDVRWFSRDCSRHESMKNDNRQRPIAGPRFANRSAYVYGILLSVVFCSNDFYTRFIT